MLEVKHMDYFPLSLAVGKAFCNRVEETKHILTNIKQSRPTIITSPRRYGKTSLAMNAILKQKLDFAKFDFLSAVDEEDIEKIILRGIGKLLGTIETGPKKLLNLATSFFAGLNIKISYDKIGLSVELGQRKNKPAHNILNIIERVEKLAEKINKKIILFFDEFQHLYEICEDQSIESVLRQIAQESKSLFFVFSGSNRHILEALFENRNRPFYKLCDKIVLPRISKADYTNLFQKAAQVTWKKKIDFDIIERIFLFTERHPYYINQLCSRLYRLNNIRFDDVEKIWKTYATEERSQIAEELDLLSKNQRRLLIVLARNNEIKEPHGRDFQIISKMPSASITQSLTFLIKKDYVYKTKEGYFKLVDPLIKYILSNKNSFLP